MRTDSKDHQRANMWRIGLGSFVHAVYSEKQFCELTLVAFSFDIEPYANQPTTRTTTRIFFNT